MPILRASEPGSRCREWCAGCGECHAALPWLVEADDSTFDAIAVQSPLPVLIDRWAPWCGPCRMVDPVVEHLSVVRAGRLKVVKVNVDIAQQTAASYQAMSIPTLFMLSQRHLVARMVRAMPEEALLGRVDAVLGGGQPDRGCHGQLSCLPMATQVGAP